MVKAMLASNHWLNSIIPKVLYTERLHPFTKDSATAKPITWLYRERIFGIIAKLKQNEKSKNKETDAE